MTSLHCQWDVLRDGVRFPWIKTYHVSEASALHPPLTSSLRKQQGWSWRWPPTLLFVPKTKGTGEGGSVSGWSHRAPWRVGPGLADYVSPGTFPSGMAYPSFGLPTTSDSFGGPAGLLWGLGTVFLAALLSLHASSPLRQTLSHSLTYFSGCIKGNTRQLKFRGMHPAVGSLRRDAPQGPL